jgi:hypothetical protein
MNEKWKKPRFAFTNLPENQRPSGAIDKDGKIKGKINSQRVCSECEGENFKILRAKRPSAKTEAYLTVCSHCGHANWLQGDRNA